MGHSDGFWNEVPPPEILTYKLRFNCLKCQKETELRTSQMFCAYCGHEYRITLELWTPLEKPDGA